MAKTTNPFGIFNATEEKTAFIEALNADIKYRLLTMNEADNFNKRLLKDYKGVGEPTVDLSEASAISYEKIALCLIDPKMTVADLKALPTSASKAIGQISKVIEGSTDDEDKSEGND